MTQFNRRWLVPEVTQTSLMDCGVAALKSVLQGFGVDVSYGRLREACQTSVDGTSIDRLEEVAQELGLDASQVVLPLDQMFAPALRSLPALVVVRRGAGEIHFVVVWRRIGPLLMLMDPARGRHFTTVSEFMRSVYSYRALVPTEAYQAWMQSDAMRVVTVERLRQCGLSRRSAAGLALQLTASASGERLALLDGALRMLERLLEAGALRRGRRTAATLAALLGQLAEGAVPGEYRVAQPAPGAQIALRGAVMLSFAGLRRSPQQHALESNPELQAARTHERPVWRSMFAMLRSGQRLSVVCALLLVPLTAGSGLLELGLFQGMLYVLPHLSAGLQTLLAAGALVLFLLVGLGLQWLLAWFVTLLGRRLELSMRLAYFRKLPQLQERYFQSRPAGDMAERGHALHVVRSLPWVLARAGFCATALCLCAAAVAWLDPASLPWLALMLLVALGLPWLSQPWLRERELRLRTHTGALMRHYLDVLLGAVSIRAHAAARLVAREHESLLTDVYRAGSRFQSAAVLGDAMTHGVLTGLAALIAYRHLAVAPIDASLLLFVYLTLQIPLLGAELAGALRALPAAHNIGLRLFELLDAPLLESAPRAQALPRGEVAPAAALRFEDVQVMANGHALLHAVNAHIPAGAHVAIVGASGSGKSTLLGALLGLHSPTQGNIWVDGARLDASSARELANATAWVDPAIQLWNSSLLDNLSFGSAALDMSALPAALHNAELYELLAQLPEGLQTSLGEGGALVSGGEGQRVRFARALLKPHPRLALLDEPFRGLPRDQRQHMLHVARSRWRQVTLLFVTHDVHETLDFDWVLVMDGGRIVEQGAPRTLSARAHSALSGLLAREDRAQREVWGHRDWRRVRLQEGELIEQRTRTLVRASGERVS